MSATYTCDECGKSVSDLHLRFSVFQKEREPGAQTVNCCSWRCAFRQIAAVKSDYFADLPYLHFDDVPEGQRASDFWDAVREWRDE